MAKHIALFISSLQKGGSERVMVNLAEYLNAEGFQVTLVTQYRGNDEYSLIPAVKRFFSEIDDSKGGRIINFIRRFLKLRAIWKQEKPDLILSFIGKNNIMAVVTSRFLGIPVVVSVRGEPIEEYYTDNMRHQAKKTFRHAAGIIMQTKESMNFFPENMQKKITLLPNPLNPSFTRPLFEGQREKRIVTVGRMDENKNHKMLINAFAKIHEEFFDFTLQIYGNGECKNALQQQIDMLNLQDVATLPGTVGNVADAIQNASLFVLTSYSEGMPNTIMEAMALGIPCISTDCVNGGPRALITDGVNGLLIPVGDEEALVRAMTDLLSHPDILQNMSNKAFELQDRYHPDKVNRQWKEYLEGVMNT